MHTFKSKIDKSFHLLLWAVMAITFYFFWQRNIASALPFSFLLVMLIDSFMHTEYVFHSNGTLHVRSGYLPKYSIDLSQIREIHRVVNMKPAYALSSDRLLIITATQTRLVSPVNAEEFIKQVRRYNHLIQVCDKRS